MNKFFTILRHTYANRVKSKSFIITSIITIALILVVSNIQTIIETFSGDDQEIILVKSEQEQWTDRISQILSSNEDLLIEPYEGTIEEAKSEVEEGNYQSVVALEEGEDELPQATYYANQIANTSTSEVVRQAVQQLKVSEATERAEVEANVLQQITAPVNFKLVALEEKAKSEEELNQTRGIVYIMLFFMYISVLMYGNMIATEVATEKSSRVMEILISSVSPVSQMFAKISGIALLGITQFSIFVLVGYVSLSQSERMSDGSVLETFGLTNIDPTTIAFAAVFFILGYLLYATLAATLGSLVSRLEDAQQLMVPMTLLVVAAFMIAVFGLSAPDAPFVTVSSYFPFFTPLIMFLRVGMLEIAVWEIALSIAIMVVSIGLLGYIGAKIYRGGVLMYGKSSSLKDIKAALQLSKRES
ncbi:ABC transporter permease [Halobacillus locisalis]|uniref:ABC transporter permease n=1 Tax=Halobacillus locisalis TaxID=220753 RepID=A0A838CR78_9BACI|nr:ABC transporter permease [Halobacillus locisalis]MBA2174577.1 ABC transporter permease [Halobacillus locisalis]